MPHGTCQRRQHLDLPILNVINNFNNDKRPARSSASTSRTFRRRPDWGRIGWFAADGHPMWDSSGRIAQVTQPPQPPGQPGWRDRGYPRPDPATRRLPRPGRPDHRPTAPPAVSARGCRADREDLATAVACRFTADRTDPLGRSHRRRPYAAARPSATRSQAAARLALPQPAVDRPDRHHRYRTAGRRTGGRRTLCAPPRRQHPGRGGRMRRPRRGDHLVRGESAVPVAAHHRPLHQYLGRHGGKTSPGSQGNDGRRTPCTTCGCRTPRTLRAPSDR